MNSGLNAPSSLERTRQPYMTGATNISILNGLL